MSQKTYDIGHLLEPIAETGERTTDEWHEVCTPLDTHFAEDVRTALEILIASEPEARQAIMRCSAQARIALNTVCNKIGIEHTDVAAKFAERLETYNHVMKDIWPKAHDEPSTQTQIQQLILNHATTGARAWAIRFLDRSFTVTPLPPTQEVISREGPSQQRKR